MQAKPTIYALGTCLVAVTVAAGTASPSRFEAHTTGAKELTLSGSAEFGSVRGTEGSGPFVLTLGAQSPTGAVLFTRADDIQPRPGVYQLSTDPSEGIQALVVTGPPERPTGVFRARNGQLTITRSSGDRIEGRFELDADGFDAADPSNEARELVVHGRFAASPTSSAER
jgi:hypothetical protein